MGRLVFSIQATAVIDVKSGLGSQAALTPLLERPCFFDAARRANLKAE